MTSPPKNGIIRATCERKVKMTFAILRGRVKTQRATVLTGGLAMCLFLAISSASNGQPGASPPALTSPAAVTPVAKITGTTVVLLDISGSKGDVIRLSSAPVEALAHCTKRQLGGREVLEFYWPGHPRIEFIVFTSSGASSTEAHYIIPADGPVVDPTPVPAPPVPPIPAPPLQVTEVVILRQELAKDATDEQKLLAASQAAIVLSTAWREAATAAGVAASVRDADQLEAKYASLKPLYVDGPVVVFVGEGEPVSVPLPDSIEGLTQLVEEKVNP